MKAKMYLHSSKDDNWEYGEDELGLNETQLNQFRYALYEVEFDVDIDESGNVKILKIVCEDQVFEEATK